MTESYEFRRFIKALSKSVPLNFEAFSSTLSPGYSAIFTDLANRRRFSKQSRNWTVRLVTGRRSTETCKSSPLCSEALASGRRDFRRQQFPVVHPGFRCAAESDDGQGCSSTKVLTNEIDLTSVADLDTNLVCLVFFWCMKYWNSIRDDQR